MIAYYALIILLVAVLVFAGYFFATLALKLTAHSKTGSFRFLYRGLYRTVPCPSYADSTYWNRFPNNTSASTHDFTYHGTIDDPFVTALAESVKGKVEGKTDAYKAGYILALVQQNVTYRRDTKTFGKAEKYGFPICTAYLRGCDCEDSAYLGASLSHLIGLDVAMFRVPGHMTYGVYLGSHRGNVDYRNNVIYNWGDNSTYGGEDGHFNIVGNYYKPGPASKERIYFVDAYWYHEMDDGSSSEAYPELYMSGNYYAGNNPGSINDDNYDGIYYHKQSAAAGKPDPAGREIDAPLPIMADDSQVCYTTTHSADDAFAAVIEYAGASIVRDDVDKRIAHEAQTGTVTYPKGTTTESAALGSTSSGGMIDSQSVVGGWPTYSASTQNEANDKTDSDGDGIPDWFETMFSQDGNLNPDGKTIDIHGRYTDFEMYLHYLVRDIVAAQAAGGAYTALD